MFHRSRRTDGCLIGVISDTHGSVRPGVLQSLKGTKMIIHAGDIGRPEVLESLRTVSPVVAVRGNVDRGEWTQALHHTEVVEIEDTLLYVIHDLSELDLDPAAAGFGAIISGHSHRPSLRKQNGVLYVNPGSAGRRRFTFPISVAVLHIRRNTVEVQLLELK